MYTLTTALPLIFVSQKLQPLSCSLYQRQLRNKRNRFFAVRFEKIIVIGVVVSCENDVVKEGGDKWMDGWMVVQFWVDLVDISVSGTQEFTWIDNFQVSSSLSSSSSSSNGPNRFSHENEEIALSALILRLNEWNNNDQLQFSLLPSILFLALFQELQLVNNVIVILLAFPHVKRFQCTSMSRNCTFHFFQIYHFFPFYSNTIIAEHTIAQYLVGRFDLPPPNWPVLFRIQLLLVNFLHHSTNSRFLNCCCTTSPTLLTNVACVPGCACVHVQAAVVVVLHCQLKQQFDEQLKQATKQLCNRCKATIQ
ncbi:hypothetical protein T4B_3779 [Trichinella pseudospiralis]|uniref:Uncharacterized protein n=1 Tax=Trichinella pseudospiralis TaxID=6337 RepID=A0A0V1IHN7_TRIPS|nr:hypothetical protein T4B_3779 [Trichinella pseudospiralis]